jgi:trimeric autotransporter adhesin
LKRLQLVAGLAVLSAFTGCSDATLSYLASISVQSAVTTVAAGNTVQFTAQGTFSDGTKRDLTTLVTWTATAPVATISSGGLATAHTQGSSVITAAFNTPGGLISGTATLTVTAPALVSISVQPAVTSVVVGNTVQFTAQGTFADGTTQDLTTLVTWTATAPVATISSGGLATTYTQGSSVITAAFNTPSGVISGTATLTVTVAPVLISISVQPAVTTVAAGNTAQFTAQGTYNDGTKQDLTTLVTWTATAPVATISSGGLAKTYTHGSSIITAAFNTPGGLISGTATLTVTAPALVSVFITDKAVFVAGQGSVIANIPMGTNQQLRAYGTYSDGGQRALTNPVWSVTPNPNSIASINSTGIVTGLGAGTVTVNATDSATSVSGSDTVNVTDATLTGIVVAPVAQTIAPHSYVLFGALGKYSDNTTRTITHEVNWKSTAPAVATVIGGLADGVAAGSTTIQASLGSIMGTAPLTVSGASLNSIALTPEPAGLGIGSIERFQAVGTFSDGTKQPITLTTTWSITPNDGSIAALEDRNPNGYAVAGVAAGSATLEVKLGGVSQTAVLSVQSLTSVSITPNPVTIAHGTGSQFKATATLADGTTQDVTDSVTWVSSTPTIATISTTGLASGIAPGTTTIGAEVGGQFATAQLTVTGATMASLAITPKAPADVALGGTQQYTATGRFSDSTTQDLTNEVTWSSSEPGVAVVDGFGAASITGFGTATVKASDSINGRAATGQNVLTVH